MVWCGHFAWSDFKNSELTHNVERLTSTIECEQAEFARVEEDLQSQIEEIEHGWREQIEQMSTVLDAANKQVCFRFFRTFTLFIFTMHGLVL